MASTDRSRYVVLYAKTNYVFFKYKNETGIYCHKSILNSTRQVNKDEIYEVSHVKLTNKHRKQYPEVPAEAVLVATKARFVKIPRIINGVGTMKKISQDGEYGFIDYKDGSKPITAFVTRVTVKPVIERGGMPKFFATGCKVRFIAREQPPSGMFDIEWRVIVATDMKHEICEDTYEVTPVSVAVPAAVRPAAPPAARPVVQPTVAAAARPAAPPAARPVVQPTVAAAARPAAPQAARPVVQPTVAAAARPAAPPTARPLVQPTVAAGARPEVRQQPVATAGVASVPFAPPGLSPVATAEMGSNVSTSSSSHSGISLSERTLQLPGAAVMAAVHRANSGPMGLSLLRDANLPPACPDPLLFRPDDREIHDLRASGLVLDDTEQSIYDKWPYYKREEERTLEPFERALKQLSLVANALYDGDANFCPAMFASSAF